MTGKRFVRRFAVLRIVPFLALWGNVVGIAQDKAGGSETAAATYRGKPVREWIDALKDKDYWVRWHATYALGRMGPDAAPAVTALERVLENREEHEYVRGGAAWALGRIGPRAASAVPLLVQSLSSKHASVRRNAARALGHIGFHGASSGRADSEASAARLTPQQVAALVKLLDDEEPTVRVAAAEALWRIERHPQALASLEAMLRNAKGAVAFEAATTLGELAAVGAPVASALTTALGHADGDVRRAAAQALGRLGPNATALLREALAKADEPTQLQAVEALSWVGPAAVPALTDALSNSRPAVRRYAARALGRFGLAARAAERDLLKAVSDPDIQVREAAAGALRRVQAESSPKPAP